MVEFESFCVFWCLTLNLLSEVVLFSEKLSYIGLFDYGFAMLVAADG